MREPVATGFYPGDPEELEETIEKLLEDAKVKNLDPEGLIVPHAGYPFSGDTAAYAYKTLENKEEEYNKIILLGPNHYGTGAEIALPDQNWKTPLGELKVDKDLIQKIKEETNARVDNKAHKREHSIEVQLPFLQYLLNSFKIVPISIKHNSLNKESIKELGEELKEVKDENTLLIASSDLIHFGPNYRYMPVENDRIQFVEEKDREFIDQVVQFNPEGVIQKGEETTVCGYGAIAALIHALKDGKKASILQHSTSFEKTQDKNNIVGYTSIAFF